MQVYGKEHKYILFQPRALQKPSHKSHTWVHKGTEYKICSVLLKLAGIINKTFFLKQLPTKGLWRTKVRNSSSLTTPTLDLLLSLELFLFLFCFLLLFVQFLVHLFSPDFSLEFWQLRLKELQLLKHLVAPMYVIYSLNMLICIWNMYPSVKYMRQSLWISVQINSVTFHTLHIQ